MEARRSSGPKICSLSPSDNRHGSDSPCPIFQGRKRAWADRKRDGTPRSGVCRACKSTHVRLFGSYSQQKLLELFEKEPMQRKKFDDGVASYVKQRKETADAEVARQGVEEDQDHDEPEESQRKKRKRDRIEEQVAAEVDGDHQPAEQAHSVHFSRSGRKRRGQYILKSVWTKENPDTQLDPNDVEKFPEREGSDVLLEYVKVYRDVARERFDFSEEEGDNIEHRRVVDDGKMVLADSQVEDAAAAAAKTLLNMSDTTQFSSTDLTHYTGVGGTASSSAGPVRRDVLPSPSPEAVRGGSADEEVDEHESQSDDDPDHAPLAKRLSSKVVGEEKSPSKKTLTEVQQYEEAVGALKDFKRMQDSEDDDPKEWESWLGKMAADVKKAILIIRFVLFMCVTCIEFPCREWVVKFLECDIVCVSIHMLKTKCKLNALQGRTDGSEEAARPFG